MPFRVEVAGDGWLCSHNEPTSPSPNFSSSEFIGWDTDPSFSFWERPVEPLYDAGLVESPDLIHDSLLPHQELQYPGTPGDSEPPIQQEIRALSEADISSWDDPHWYSTDSTTHHFLAASPAWSPFVVSTNYPSNPAPTPVPTPALSFGPPTPQSQAFSREGLSPVAIDRNPSRQVSHSHK